MNGANQCLTPAPQSGTHKVLFATYIMYLLVIPFPFLTVLGVIFAYIFRADADDYMKSHCDYLIRSFWIGLLYFVIASILCFVLVGFVLVPLTELWWLIRIAIGLKAFLECKSVVNVKTWWF